MRRKNIRDAHHRHAWKTKKKKLDIKGPRHDPFYRPQRKPLPVDAQDVIATPETCRAKRKKRTGVLGEWGEVEHNNVVSIERMKNAEPKSGTLHRQETKKGYGNRLQRIQA